MIFFVCLTRRNRLTYQPVTFWRIATLDVTFEREGRMKRLVILLVVGSFFLLHQSVSAQELVVNGGFETGTFAGWTQVLNTGFTGVDTSGPHSGTFNMDTGPVGSLGGIAQTLATTTGGHYTLSAWYNNLVQTTGGTSEFQIQWEGNTVFDILDPPVAGYVNVTLNLTATTNGSEVRFLFRQDPSFIHFDDASVVGAAVPEPATWALMGLSGSAIGTGLYWNRKRRLRRRTRRGQVPATT
jgi:hypothetical protein